MNRQQRRATIKVGDTKEKPHAPAEDTSPAPPGLALRLVASVLLSQWMLRRVNNPEVLGMLREVARQAGRDGVKRQLDERLRDRR